MSGVEVRGPGDGLLDGPLATGTRGLGDVEDPTSLVWRARCKDDDGRVWRSSCEGSAAGLPLGWGPAKRSGGDVAALASLRPVAVDLRVEAPDGRFGARTVIRRLVAEGVVTRRWREKGLVAVLHRPPVAAPCATVVIAGDVAEHPHAPLAAALLASRGALVLVATAGEEVATERLAAVPGAAEPVRLDAADVPLPPGVPATASPDPSAWPALLERLHADPDTVTSKGSEPSTP